MSRTGPKASAADAPSYGPHNVPSGHSQWKQLLVEMSSRYFYSSRVPDEQDVVRVTTRDVMMRLGAEISHTTVRNRMEDAARRIERAEYDRGDFLWSPEPPEPET